MMQPNYLRIVDEDVAAIIVRDLPWEKLAGCQVAVTGAGGFLGGYVCRALLALRSIGKISRPVKVVAMVRDLSRAQERFADLIKNPDFALQAWDLNAIAVPDLGDTHYVIHAASQASPRFYSTDPVGTLLPNSVGTAALLEALRRSKDPRGFLFVSSSEVYGSVASETSLQESHYGIVDPATVRACYAESKRVGESMCVAWHHQYGLPTFMVRPFHTYGPGLTPEDGRVFADFAYNVVRNENIIMNSDGSARRAFCYVTDAIVGFFAALLNGTPATAYNVANPNGELSVMELAEMLVGLFPEKTLKVERRFQSSSSQYVPSPYSRLVPDVTRLQSLGWSPEVSPAEGFKRMITAHSH